MDAKQTNNVVYSKMAAKNDLLTMLWPTLGATMLYFIPTVLLSTIFGVLLGAGDQIGRAHV